MFVLNYSLTREEKKKREREGEHEPIQDKKKLRATNDEKEEKKESYKLCV